MCQFDLNSQNTRGMLAVMAQNKTKKTHRNCFKRIKKHSAKHFYVSIYSNFNNCLYKPVLSFWDCWCWDLHLLLLSLVECCPLTSHDCT